MPHRQAQAEYDRHNRLQPRVPSPVSVREAGETTGVRVGPGRTVVLRRQPTRVVGGQPQGGHTDVFELICCERGDDPNLDYRDVSPGLQRIRGQYPIAARPVELLRRARGRGQEVPLHRPAGLLLNLALRLPVEPQRLGLVQHHPRDRGRGRLRAARPDLGLVDWGRPRGDQRPGQLLVSGVLPVLVHLGDRRRHLHHLGAGDRPAAAGHLTYGQPATP
jgi:hypothetical protein